MVSGTVVLRDSTPIAGLIVQASDTRDSTVARSLTNARGQFQLRVSAPGRYSLKVLRIGYRPTVGPAVVVGTGPVDPVRIVFAGEAVVLASVGVRDRRTCRVGADTGLTVARVWEEARKAMLSTQLDADDSALVAERVEYDRLLDSTAHLVRVQHIHSSLSPTRHAFSSRSARELDSTGYVVSDSTGTTYFAPDAEVLLSESFAAGHCFHLVAAPSDAPPSLIGVGFEPTDERRGKREIEGTLWVDQTSAELRSLEFRYTNLPDLITAAGAGGRVELLRLSDGRWLIRRWSVRMPQLGPRGRTIDNSLRRVVITAPNQVVRGIQITGGEVTRVMRRDTLAYESTGPGVTVQLTSADTLLRMADALLEIDGTDYAALSDSAGLIRLSPVLAGRYRARVSTPLMDSLNVVPVFLELEVHDDAGPAARVETVALPRAREFVSAACPRDAVRSGEAMVYGRVRSEHAVPLANAAVTVTWPTVSAVAVSDSSGSTERTVGALTDFAGRWRVCGVPHDAPLVVTVMADSGSDAHRLRLAGDQPFGAVDLVTHPQVANASRDSVKGVGTQPSSRALVEIVVSELGGVPLPDVNVDVVAAGATRTVVTGPSGRALLPDVTPGLLTIRARRIGFRQGQLAVTVEAGRNTIPIILSAAAMPTLDTVRVVGNQRLSGLRRLDEFETRRLNRQATASFTREDIRKRNPVDAWQMLLAVPSIKIADTSGVTVESTRGRVTKPDGSQAKCYLAVMVDGLVMNATPGHEGFDLRQLPRPEDIHGIEVFAGPSSIPLQYLSTGKNGWCGLIAIWTR